MPSFILEIAGWLPAIVFPVATFLQLWVVLKNRSGEGVSKTTWLLFGIANIGLYIYAEKYDSIQSIIGMLLTAGLDFLIVLFAWLFGKQSTVEEQQELTPELGR
ncbi:hypothetical protein [Spartinivicinus poritis]|uniref:PQ-loop repeat-containing protein n=1 Tax=Spartinivicinus poritis TaxID=2994640 RepID=A0ABT5U333_9GAMM|nr:hypothetical protein [Spartinivicinus sp. A2-2]MDE1460779.1 hypothetical protein [Spartinivicinus sp. A2-2]